MNNTILLFVFILLFAACKTSVDKPDPVLIEKFSQLHFKRDYFRLKEHYDLHKEELGPDYSLFYGALLNSYFNQMDQSNDEIEQLAKNKYDSFSDSLFSVLYTAKVSNHVRLFEYSKAAETCKLLIDNYHMYFDSTDFHDLSNGYIFWKALDHIPKQEKQIINKSEITIQTDNRGFWNIDVELADTVCPFMFDTGAGTSMIKRSIAINSGYTIIELEYPVKAFTGKEVETNLAIAEKIKIGDVIFDNVIFLVIDDDNLMIPNKSIPIGGIIGYPVIASMEEICMRKGVITISDEVHTETPRNMAINHLSPIIATRYQNDTLLLKFDTGALRSNFQPLFYHQYQNEIDKNCSKQTIRAGSVGGPIEFEVYKTGAIDLQVGNARASISNANIFTESLKRSNLNYHGNLGQDFINQFDEVVISFKNSSVTFTELQK